MTAMAFAMLLVLLVIIGAIQWAIVQVLARKRPVWSRMKLIIAGILVVPVLAPVVLGLMSLAFDFSDTHGDASQRGLFMLAMAWLVLSLVSIPTGVIAGFVAAKQKKLRRTAALDTFK